MEIIYNATPLGTLNTPAEKTLRLCEIKNDDRLFVSLYDVGKALGYKATSSSGRSTAPSLLQKALVESKTYPIRCWVLSTEKSLYLQLVDLNRLPLLIQSFIEFVVNAPRHYQKYNLYFDNACNLLDWLSAKIIPLFYETNELSPEEIKRQKHREQTRQWKLNNPDKVREHRRRWWANNPEYMKRWREKHREQILEYQRQYAARERAKKNAAQASLFPENAS